MRYLSATIVLVVAVAGVASPMDQASVAPVAPRPLHARRVVNRTFTLTASDFAYRGLPVHAPAGWLTFRLVNTGRETHMLAVARVPAGSTTADFVDSLVRVHIAPNTTFWSGVDVVSPGDTAGRRLRLQRRP
jgi:hypothetical protein